MEDIMELKRSCETALGKEKFQKYLKILGSYFTFNLSPDQMEKAISQLLGEHFSYHTKLFNAMNVKSLHNSQYLKTKPSSENKKKLKDIAYFKNEDFLKTAMFNSDPRDELEYDFPDSSLCSHHGYFPDVKMLCGYIYTYIWSKEYSFCEATDQCVEFLTISIRVLIKGILMQILKSRGQYHQHNNFLHAFSSCEDNESSENLDNLQSSVGENTVTVLSAAGEVVPKMQPSVEWNRIQAMNKMAKRDKSLHKNPITLIELYDLLLTNPELLPFTSVHTQILDRCLTALTNTETSPIKKISEMLKSN